MRYFPGFLLFGVFFFAPYLGGLDLEGRMNPVVVHLFETMLAEPAFRTALITAMVTHAVLFAFTYPVYRVFSKRLKSLPQIRPAFASLAAATLLWLLIYGWNQWLFHESRHQWIPAHLLLPALVLSSTAGLALLIGHLRLGFTPPRRQPVLALSLAFAVIMLVGVFYNDEVEASAETRRPSRDVIIIGIDSLSQRVLQSHPEAMPHFNKLYSQSVAYTNAWSPMGRTCPTWLSILSGRTPAQHGSICNLRHPNEIDRTGLLSSALRQEGYGTLFGLDERRFCNIDETFGFDAVVGPDHGAIDFLIQKFNDSPLVNVLLQLDISRKLLPHSRLNVAAHATYPADDFVDAVLTDVKAEHKPLFMAVHLESAHYPYVARDALPVAHTETRFLREHVNALSVVDAQIDRLMRGLAQSGRLKDSLVIFLSDHGESFGEPKMMRRLDGSSTEVAVYGHGTSVLMPEQHHVVLAFLQYRDGKPVNRPAHVNDMVSLMDLKAVMSGYVENGTAASLPSRECVVFETGVRMTALADYTNMNEQEAAQVGAKYYTVDNLARMHIRQSKVAELIGMKDVGARCGDLITKYDADDRSLASYRESADGFVEIALDARAVGLIRSYQSELARAAMRADQSARSQ